MITEFAKDFLNKFGVKVVVPGENEGAMVSQSAVTNETNAQVEETNGAKEKSVTVREKYEVCDIDFTV